MFGIGLPEMIVILAVALIVVGPEKLPDMARNVAKWVFELKKTVNQVKASLEDDDNLIGSVHSDLKKTGDNLKKDLLETDHFTFHEPGVSKNSEDEEADDIIDIGEDSQKLQTGEEISGDDVEVQDTGATDPESGDRPA